MLGQVERNVRQRCACVLNLIEPLTQPLDLRILLCRLRQEG